MILDYKGINIFYTDTGKGEVIVLLHGFLEDHTMWYDLGAEISKKNRVVCIDLLGHGKTGVLGYIHTMETMATSVKAVLNHLRLRKYSIIGHSMGGYVALAFAKLFPNNIKGVCLLNSTYEADDSERKQLRTRANKMAQTNFKSMVRMSFTNLFSAKSKLEHQEAFEEALQIALKTPLQGYMAAQEGMKRREDFSTSFAQAPYKKAILLGKKDTVINVKSTIEFAENHNIDTHIFSEGHMSHIENKTDFIKEIVHFIEKT